MARINVERVFDRLDYEVKTALKKALETTAPEKEIDIQILYKEFKKQVIRNCKQWENMDSSAVDTD
jgi:hypothetical protein